jgi:hypothetical protein
MGGRVGEKERETISCPHEGNRSKNSHTYLLKFPVPRTRPNKYLLSGPVSGLAWE